MQKELGKEILHRGNGGRESQISGTSALFANAHTLIADFMPRFLRTKNTGP